jgi:hypothetical protein
LNIKIPNDGSSVYDLSNSYLDFEILPQITSNLTVAGAVYDLTLFFNATNTAVPIYNLAPIRRVLVSLDRAGIVDTRENNNRMMSTLLEYQMGRNEKLSQSFKSTYQLSSCYGIQAGPFSQLVGLGTNPSFNRPLHAMIPLKHLTSLGNNLLPIAKAGSMELSLDFEDPSRFAVAWNARIPVPRDCLDIVGPVTNPNVVTDSTPFLTLESSPYHVGQAVVVECNNGGLLAATQCLITGITQNTTTSPYCLQLTLSGNLPTVNAGSSLTNITIQDISPSNGLETYSVTFQNAQLILSRLQRKIQIPKQMSFWQYLYRPITPLTTSNLYTFSQQVPKGVLNVFVLFYDAEFMYSHAPNMVSWQTQLRGLSRSFPSVPILFRSNQHFEMMERIFLNSGWSLGDLTEGFGIVGVGEANNRFPTPIDGNHLITMCGITLPSEPGVDFMDVEFNLQAAAGTAVPQIMFIMESPTSINLPE